MEDTNLSEETIKAETIFSAKVIKVVKDT